VHSSSEVRRPQVDAQRTATHRATRSHHAMGNKAARWDCTNYAHPVMHCIDAVMRRRRSRRGKKRRKEGGGGVPGGVRDVLCGKALLTPVQSSQRCIGRAPMKWIHSSSNVFVSFCAEERIADCRIFICSRTRGGRPALHSQSHRVFSACTAIHNWINID
jgi:hypothetical protein